MELLEKILEKENLNGRCCENAVVKALEYLNDGYEWIVDIDLERFFDTVDQDRLINIIMRTIKDGDVVSLIRKYLSAGVMDKGITKATFKIIPTSKGYQLVAKTDWLKFAINIERLRKRGLIFLSDQYQKVHIEI